MIRITSKREGFRRAGIAHSEEPKAYRDDDFTEEQLTAIKEEPMLIVQILPDQEDETEAGSSGPVVHTKESLRAMGWDKAREFVDQGYGIKVRGWDELIREVLEDQAKE